MAYKVALMYDFDQTLCAKNIQEYALLPKLGLDPERFWSEVNQVKKANEMDSVLAYMYLLLKKARSADCPVRRSDFQQMGRDIVFYSGVPEFFGRINGYGKELGLQVEHFVISSGTREIIEGCPIYDCFTKVYACQFHYDASGVADWPAVAVNYTNKTQFLFRINKNALDISDDTTVNSYMDYADRDIPFSRMIYIGDGFTDVPCMKLVKSNGGCSIAVYGPKKSQVARSLADQQRVNFIAPADYSPASRLDNIIHDVLKAMAAQTVLAKYQPDKETVK